ncbi:LacI family transcriptional regulator [Devosia geojensis]|uniref:LacI family transcriptional regulator n=1 Tax=Devosia geojensis TaxID=443610 RepID=A0A0F5FTE6_9HYPH|nr:LacI family DNA-binding transcriptional regulator [Devosia geojensis]KKB11462.1 LacI family transcriptional regulator [Devosia geojensis]
MPRVTLATIARTSGLSKFAVSRALSGKSGVSEETRRRVTAIAEELGYVRAAPQVPATTMIGLVFHDMDLVNSELQVLIQSGVQAEAQRLGYGVAVRWTHVADEIEEHVRQTAGAILVGPHERAALDRAYATGKPLVRSGWLMPLEQVDQVSGTDHEAGSAVADYLLALGHRSILYVHGMPGYRGRMERLYGLREVVERREDVTFTEVRFDADTRFTEALLALKAGGVNPTAFFCAHDGLAVTVISELLRLGYSIPQDASVIGFGDYSSAVQISPALTTVRVHGRQHGAACVRLIDDRLSSRVPAEIAVRVQIAGHIIERDSCGPAPG